MFEVSVRLRYSRQPAAVRGGGGAVLGRVTADRAFAVAQGGVARTSALLTGTRRAVWALRAVLWHSLATSGRRADGVAGDS